MPAISVMIVRAVPRGLLLFFSAAALPSSAAELSDIPNYREYSPLFASSGQPTKKQLELLKDHGFERVIYIAFTNSGKAYADEDQIVKRLGMDYVQIPVDWSNPQPADFYAFAGAMASAPERKTLLHCQVNYRASAFGLLYRVIHDGTSVADAKRDMNTVWEPNEIWREFIFRILRENDVSADCDGCDWSAADEH